MTLRVKFYLQMFLDVFRVFRKSILSIWLPRALRIRHGAVTLQKYLHSILRITQNRTIFIFFGEKKKKPDGQLVRHAVDSTSSKVTYIAFPTGTIPLEYPGVKCLALGLSDNGGSQKFSRFTDHPFPLLAKIFHCKAKANTAYDTIPKLYHMHILHCSLNKLGQTLIKSRCTTGHQ